MRMPASVSPRGARSSRSAGGFSLLEVLVAFMVLALVATALFQLFGGAMRNAGAASEWSRALLVAQSRLAEAASVQPLREGSAAGNDDDGRIAWQTTVAAYTPPDVDPDLEQASQATLTRLFRVTVEVRYAAEGGRQHTVTLSTLKLGARNPA